MSESALDESELRSESALDESELLSESALDESGVFFCVSTVTRVVGQTWKLQI